MADDPSAKDDKTNDKQKDDQGDGLGDAGKRALERERQARRDAEARLRELEPLAAKAKELEDAKKSGEQKLADEIKALKDDLSKERRRALIAEVAREKGLTGVQARRLQGESREELEADADDLLESFGGSKSNGNGGGGEKEKDKEKDQGGGDADDDGKRGDPGRRPKEKLRSGAVTDSDDDEFDPEKVADSIRSGRI